MKNEEIKKLVEGARENREYAQTELVRFTYKKAFFIANSIVHDEEIAKDIVQDAYVTAFQKIYQLKDDEKFVGWLNRIVNNKTIDYLRSKQGKHTELVFSTLDNEEDELSFEESIRDEKVEWNPEGNMDYQVLKEGLEEVLDTLPANQRLALLMYYYEEKSVGEIAEAMDVRQSTIKSALAYGRKKIKDCIESMRAKGTSFYGMAPISLFVQMLNMESRKINVDGMTEVIKLISETGGVVGGTVVTAEASKHSASGIAKWWASKSAGVKVGACVAATAVAGGGIYVAIDNSTTWEFTTDVVHIVQKEISDTTSVSFIPSIEYTFEYSPITKELTSFKSYIKCNPDKIIEYSRNQNEMYGDMAYQLFSKEALENYREVREKIEGLHFTSGYTDDGMYEEITIVDMRDFSNKNENTQNSIWNQYGWILKYLYDKENNKFYYNDNIEDGLENVYNFQGNVIGTIDYKKK